MKHTCTACGHVDEINIGRVLGSVKSKAKSKAARENGKLGGWPKGKKREPKLTAAKKREIEQWDREMGCESTDD